MDCPVTISGTGPIWQYARIAPLFPLDRANPKPPQNPRNHLRCRFSRVGNQLAQSQPGCEANGQVAQLVEQAAFNHLVLGSSPSLSTTSFMGFPGFESQLRRASDARLLSASGETPNHFPSPLTAGVSNFRKGSVPLSEERREAHWSPPRGAGRRGRGRRGL